MSNGVNGNSNSNSNSNEINLQELRGKLVNIAETEYKNEGTKFLFNTYNTQRTEGENAVQHLDKEELEKFINDIKAFDKNNNGRLELDEIDAFVQSFNSAHPDEKITTADVKSFVKGIESMWGMYHNGKGIKYSTNTQRVGEALSSKQVRLQCLNDDCEIVEILLQIELFATNDNSLPLMYVTRALEGEEYLDLLASKYGFTGENAWNNFTTHSLLKPNPNTYEVNFFPRTEYEHGTQATDGTGNSPVVRGLNSTDGITSYYMPNGFDRDPQLILAEYQNTRAQQAMSQFIEYMETVLNDTEKALDGCLDTYGWTAKTAEWISKLWNDSDEAGSGTKEQVRNSIAEARALLDEMRNADNSMEGILGRKDFGAFYKSLTGMDFRVQNIIDFLEAKDEYFQAQSAFAMHKYVHENLNGILTLFEGWSFNDESQNNTKSQSDNLFSSEIFAVDNTTSISPLPEDNPFFEYKGPLSMFANKQAALAYLGEVFYPVLGISPENWKTVINEVKSLGIDPMKFCRDLLNNIVTATDAQTSEILGTTNPADMKNVVSSYESYYNRQKQGVVGKGDMMDVVEKYHKSQVVGGALVSGLAQVGLYSFAMLLCPASAPAIVSGLCSGGAYATSYAAVEVSDRMSNKIDDKKDLWSNEAGMDLLKNTAIEFVAGFMFDGALKKIFSNPEKRLLEVDKMMTAERLSAQATSVGDSFIKGSFIKNFIKVRFSKERIMQILQIRGAAGVIDGAKDSLKESFKESVHMQFNLKTICSTFLIGAVSNALFIKFKNSAFAKKNHRLMGKFIEKAPKKEGKTAMKDCEAEVQLSSEDVEIGNMLNKIRTQIISDVRAQVQQDNQYSELLDFVLNNEEELDNLILSCYIIDNLLDGSDN